MGTITDIANQYPWLTGVVLATIAAIAVFIVSALVRRGIIPRIPSHEEVLRIETELGIDLRDQD